MDRTRTYDIRQLRGRPTLLAAHCPSRMAVLLIVAASAACSDRSAPRDKSPGPQTVERPSPPTTPSVSTTVTGKATPTQTVKWLEKVAEIVMDPNAKKPMKVAPYPPNRSVTYSFRVDGSTGSKSRCSMRTVAAGSSRSQARKSRRKRSRREPRRSSARRRLALKRSFGIDSTPVRSREPSPFRKRQAVRQRSWCRAGRQWTRTRPTRSPRASRRPRASRSSFASDADSSAIPRDM